MVIVYPCVRTGASHSGISDISFTVVFMIDINLDWFICVVQYDKLESNNRMIPLLYILFHSQHLIQMGLKWICIYVRKSCRCGVIIQANLKYNSLVFYFVLENSI